MTVNTNPFRFLNSVLFVVATLCCTAGPLLAALDNDQQAKLNTANTNIKSANADLNAARSSAGTADNPAKGSRLKLTQMRLDQAAAKLNTAAEALSGLPDDDENVKTAQQNHDTVAAGVAEVQAIISGGAAPPPKKEDAPAANDPPAGEKPAAAPAPAKLHYQDEEKLKNARYHLRDANGYTNAAAEIVARLDGEGEPAVHKDVKDGLATVKTASGKLDNSFNNLDQLPADHPSVASVLEEANATKAKLGAIQSRLEAADTQLDKLTNLANYPNFDIDHDKVQSFIRRYGNFQMTLQQPETLLTVISEDGKVLEEIQRIAKTYLPLVEQKTEAGAKMENRLSYFVQKRSAFVAEALAYKEQLPGLIDADIADAMSLAQQGVNEQKPLFFGENSGIEQRLGWAETKVGVLVGFDPVAGKPYQDKLAQTRSEVEKMADSLSQQIIDANNPPSDNYAGPDRDAIIARALDGWHHQQPDAELVAAYIPSEAWEREVKWEWFNGAFSKVDRSKLQVQLLIKHNDTLGVIRPMNMRMNHLKGDTVIAIPLDSIDDKVQPFRYLKLEKVK